MDAAGAQELAPAENVRAAELADGSAVCGAAGPCVTIPGDADTAALCTTSCAAVTEPVVALPTLSPVTDSS